MKFLSVCSGIEAASVAWEPLGWRAAALAEIEPFPCRVLAARFGASRPMFLPDPLAADSPRERRRRASVIARLAELPETGRVPNFGDLMRFKEWPDATVDLLVGGTPCQSFSVAGLRKGLDDPRGNLALVYLAVAHRYRPRWIVWENVPGVLSSNDGRDFGAFLGALGELGYGWAYRVLDAQFVRTCRFPGAVPQRRRRVFVVGYLGNWRPPAAVLFDAESLRGNPPPRRIAGQGLAPTLASRPSGGGGLGTDFDLDGGLITNAIDGAVARALTGGHSAAGPMDVSVDNFVAHALRGEGFDGSEDGTGRGTPLVAVAPTLRAGGNQTGGDRPPGTDVDTCEMLVAYAIQERAVSMNPNAGPQGKGWQEGGAYTLEARHHAQAVAFDLRGREEGAVPEGPHETANIRAASGGSSRSYIAQPWSVRRLTPIECERLQGFPDGYTDVPRAGSSATPDGPRYKALGNSMAVNAMAWIGERINSVEGHLALHSGDI